MKSSDKYISTVSSEEKCTFANQPHGCVESCLCSNTWVSTAYEIAACQQRYSCWKPPRREPALLRSQQEQKACRPAVPLSRLTRRNLLKLTSCSFCICANPSWELLKHTERLQHLHSAAQQPQPDPPCQRLAYNLRMPDYSTPNFLLRQNTVLYFCSSSMCFVSRVTVQGYRQAPFQAVCSSPSLSAGKAQ